MSAAVAAGAFGRYIRRAVAGEHLSQQDAYCAISAIMRSETTPAQVAAFLIALAAKPETAAELAGAAAAMRRHCIAVSCERRPLLDVCGTGGDGAGTFNISTAVAFVVAGAGVTVAKHGNRAMSSHCGSADVLEELGVNISMSPQRAAHSLHNHGIAFLFAQQYHPSMRHVASVRREIGVPTVFNLIGPLTNPAAPSHQIVGVAQPQAQNLLAAALQRMGCERGAVVHSEDGLDEVSVFAPTTVIEWQGTRVISYHIKPEQFGLTNGCRSDIAGGDAAANAALLVNILRGAPGPGRDIVALNAALALYICGRAATLRAGVDLARSSIDSGAAYARLTELKAASQA